MGVFTENARTQCEAMSHSDGDVLAPCRHVSLHRFHAVRPGSKETLAEHELLQVVSHVPSDTDLVAKSEEVDA